MPSKQDHGDGEAHGTMQTGTVDSDDGGPQKAHSKWPTMRHC